MRVSVFGVFATLITLAGAQLRTGSLECYEGLTEYQMVMTVNKNGDNDMQFISALNSSGEKVETCNSVSTPSLFTLTSSYFKIAINVTKDSLIVDAPCGYTKNDLVYEWRFLTTKFADVLVKGLDVLFVAKCNFSDASPSQISSSFTIVGTPAENAPQDTSLAFVLEVVDAAGTQIHNINLGDQIRLRIKQTAGDPVIVSGHSCYASGDGVFDGSNTVYEILTSLGCPKLYGTAALITAGFIGSQGSAVSGLIEQFTFIGSNTVHYQCLVYYCYAGNPECGDYCTSATSVGRKKREVEEEYKTLTSIRISSFSSPINEPHKESTDCPSTDTPPQSCLDNVGVIAAFSVLAGLLLLTIAVAVFVSLRCSRLIAHQHSGKKPKL